MDIIKELEYPIPVLYTDIEKIVVKTSRNINDTFTISNSGGNILKGEIICDIENLVFSIKEFEGNRITVKYKIDVKTLKPFDVIKSSFVIISNGGEKKLDVIIRVTLPVLLTKLDTKITNLEEFYTFSKENPVEARFLFASQDFMIWLDEINFKNMELYNYFLSDHIKERGLDNFLLSADLKESAKLVIPYKKLSFKIEPFSQEVTTHMIKVLMEGSGYFKTKIGTKNESPWLHIETKTISSTDFVNTDFKEVHFYINSKYVFDKIVSDYITIEGCDTTLCIEVIKKQVLTMRLSKTNFENNDSGELIIDNYSDKDIVIELFEQDEFIKFEGKKYFISKNAVIPFKIKMKAIQTASNFFKKQPVINSAIIIKAYLDEETINKELPISIGSLI